MGRGGFLLLGLDLCCSIRAAGEGSLAWRDAACAEAGVGSGKSGLARLRLRLCPLALGLCS